MEGEEDRVYSRTAAVSAVEAKGSVSRDPRVSVSAEGYGADADGTSGYL